MNKRILSYGISLLVVVLAGLAYVKQDSLFDIWRLRDYEAPAEIVKLADDTTMNESARRLFYVYHPTLEDKASFNAHCANTEQTIVLGCYIQYQGIYLYKVTDERLKGVVEVTAAHEMLHAAYDRLSSKDRKKVDSLTAQVAETITDERLKSTIENYRKKDPGVVPNELHSILATEVRNLPAELETYYARYFTNRSAVVDLTKYQEEFTQREKQVEQLDAELKTLKAEIDTLDQSLQVKQTELKATYDSLQAQRRSGDTEGYNALVPTYNRAVSDFNAGVNRQKQLVTRYNAMVEQRNSLATEENELTKAIDSRDTLDNE